MSFIIIAVPLLAGIAVCYGFRVLEDTRFVVKGVVGPYFAAIALLFGLFASLMATEVWQKVAHANKTVETEINGLRSLLRLEEAFAPDSGPIRAHVNDYLATIAQDLAPGGSIISEPVALDALRKLYAAAAAPGFFRGNVAATSAYLQSLETVRSSRIERISDRNHHVSREKYAILFLFGVLTQIAIALCHHTHSRALAVAVMLFSVAFSAAAGILVILDDPYNGTHLIVTNVVKTLP